MFDDSDDDALSLVVLFSSLFLSLSLSCINFLFFSLPSCCLLVLFLSSSALCHSLFSCSRPLDISTSMLLIYGIIPSSSFLATIINDKEDLQRCCNTVPLLLPLFLEPSDYLSLLLLFFMCLVSCVALVLISVHVNVDFFLSMFIVMFVVVAFYGFFFYVITCCINRSLSSL